VKLQVFLSAASRDFPMVRRIAQSLEATGLVEYTMRWWDTADEWTGRDHKLTRDEKAQHSTACLEAIAAAQLVWSIRTPTPSEGRTAELGAALERRRVMGSPYIVLTGVDVGTSIFHAVDYLEFSNALGANEVLRIARQKVRAA
jgi:hypothetical protein